MSSTRRRRWSNEHLSSLISFQNKSKVEESGFFDHEKTDNDHINTEDESDLLKSTLECDELNTTLSGDYADNSDLMKFSFCDNKDIKCDKLISLENSFAQLPLSANSENTNDKKCIGYTEIYIENNLNSKIQGENSSNDNMNQNQDIWTTLSLLDNKLGPTDDEENKASEIKEKERPDKKRKDHSRILRRLSREFKNTPKVFTEKLLSIIEESIVANDDLPANEANESINLQNMTSEFRKLCKYIDDDKKAPCIADESMPEWAPSLDLTTLNSTNVTTFNVNTNDSLIENIETPPHVKNCFTPKQVLNLKTGTPLKNFSPSADKSFEYWEAMCNMMCDQHQEKAKRFSIYGTQESAKSTMSEMLSICERQLASLDDSTIDIRSSAPLKQTFNELKVPAVQRSKSTSEVNFYSPKDLKVYDDGEDKSLMIEILKRRQRCMDTAKLMLEIDGEDNITNEDKKCLQTLYKLGIQDKNEVETDLQFLSTITECLEYKNYLTEKNKPISNLLKRRSAIHNNRQDITELKERSARNSSDSSKKDYLETKHSSRTVSAVNKSQKINNENKKLLHTQQNNKNSITPKSKLTPKPVEQRQQTPYSLIKNKSCTNKLSSVQRHEVTPNLDNKNFHRKKTYVAKEADMSPRNISSRQPEHTLGSKALSKVTPKMTETFSRGNLGNVKPLKLFTSDSKKSNSNSLRTATNKTPVSVSNINYKSHKNRVKSKPDGPSNSDIKECASDPNNVLIKESRNGNELPKLKLFVSPGTSPSVMKAGRLKPVSYFSSKRTPTLSSKLTPQSLATDNVRSPIGTYINSIDNQFIKNVHAKTNDMLLTPISKGSPIGKSPQLKFALSSKENKSPQVRPSFELPNVRYEQTKNVLMEVNKSPRVTGPKLKTLLKEKENSVVIRHQGRKIMNPDASNIEEASIRVQKAAEKVLR